MGIALKRITLLSLTLALMVLDVAPGTAGPTWARVGELPAGAPVTAIAVVPWQADAAFVGTAGRGVIYTSDGGRSWLPAGTLPFATVLSLAVDPKDPERILAGTHGGGVYVSEDRGKTWSPSNLKARNVVALAVRDEDGLAIAAADGPWPGLYRSQDGGHTWEASSGSLPERAHPTAACAAGKFVVVGVRWPDGGYIFYISEDGRDWWAAGQDIPEGVSEVASLACSSEDVWAVTNAGLVHGRPGDSWVLEVPLPEGRMGTIAFGNGRLYITTAKGIYLRIPGGWQKQTDLSQEGLLAFGGKETTGYRFLAVLRSGAVMENFQGPAAPVQPAPAAPVARGLPTDPVKPPEQPSEDVAYFPETGHTVARGFLAFWKANGGLPIFGYPLTEEFTENGRTVQYFERARMEYYPEYAGTANVVQLGQLGREYTKGRYFVNIDFFPSKPDRYFFRETEHSLAGAFLRFWNENGGIRLFGYPLSEEIAEEGLTVQYFERARFEYHPETPDKEVQLSDLGRRLLVQRGWLSGR